MKRNLTKKALENAIERAKRAKYLVDTDIAGAVNLVLLNISGTSFCNAWQTGDSEEAISHVRFLAFGDSTSGEVLISCFGDSPGLHLIGKGREEHGKLLLVRRLGDVFTVVWNCDEPDNKATFFMTATDDVLLIQLITLLAEKHFIKISGDNVQSSVALLMGGVSDG